jgi:hypothetical protein
MCINDYETEIGGQGPVEAVELLGKNSKLESAHSQHISQLSRNSPFLVDPERPLFCLKLLHVPLFTVAQHPVISEENCLSHILKYFLQT